MNDIYDGTARYPRNAAPATQNTSMTFADLERATDEEILNSFKERRVDRGSDESYIALD